MKNSSSSLDEFRMSACALHSDASTQSKQSILSHRKLLSFSRAFSFIFFLALCIIFPVCFQTLSRPFRKVSKTRVLQKSEVKKRGKYIFQKRKYSTKLRKISRKIFYKISKVQVK